MKDIKKLEEKLGIVFIKKDYIRTAMVHRSYLNEHKDFLLDHNERLEFLGDAVLELVTTEYLYVNYPNPEGELTNWRASLVNSKMLAEVAKQLEIEIFMHMSKGEAKDINPKARNYILANAMEAVIGAIYLDQGMEAVTKFIKDNILIHLPHILKNELYFDPKSKFQERAQENLGITPNYKVLEETGPDHNKFFKVGVFLDDELAAEGEGTSKQEAQVDAAQKAIENKGW